MSRALIFCLIILLCALCTTAAIAANPPPPVPEIAYITQKYSPADIAKWSPSSIDGVACIISPPIVAPPGCEMNFHTVEAETTGPGTVKLSIGYSQAPNLEEVIAKRHLHSTLQPLNSATQINVTSPYKGQRYAWLLLQPASGVRIKSITYRHWRGKNTLFGHTAGVFTFAGTRLPYRIMYPRNFNPARSYPLILTVPGSGGVGDDNVRSMEMVICARYMFTNYYYNTSYECFSLVTQVPPLENIPAPYYPKGNPGAPTRYHPDWPAVNEKSWYTQATLALIRELTASDYINIDRNRIYFTGFSYGGKACFEFLKADPDLFAGAICVAGWPIGPAGSNPTGPFLLELKRQVQRYKQVPIRIFAGSEDPMHFGSQAAHAEIAAQGGDSLYIEFPKTAHVQSANKVWANIKYITWLFANNKERLKMKHTTKSGVPVPN